MTTPTNLMSSRRWRITLAQTPPLAGDPPCSLEVGAAWVPSLRAAALVPAALRTGESRSVQPDASDLRVICTALPDGGLRLTPADPGMPELAAHWLLLAQRMQQARRSVAAPPQRQAGQALVEFALVMPIFLALVLTFISLWPILNAGDAVAAAASAGVHEAAITGGNRAATTARVTENLQAVGLGLTTPAKIELSCSPCPRYQPVTVVVAVAVEPWIPLPWLRDTYAVDATITRASEIDGGTAGSGPGDIRQPGGPGAPSIPGLPGLPGLPTLPGGDH